jgi:hypothetical protein
MQVINNFLKLCLQPRVEAPHSYTRTFHAVPVLASYCNVSGKLTIVKFSVTLFFIFYHLFYVQFQERSIIFLFKCTQIFKFTVLPLS